MHWLSKKGASRLPVAGTQNAVPLPETVDATSQAPAGLFASLTAEQRKAALAYRGPEDHGDPGFIKA